MNRNQIAIWINKREGPTEGTVKRTLCNGRASSFQSSTEGGAQADNVAPVNIWTALGYLLRQPKIWGMALGFAAYGYSFYLFLSWLPTYVEKQLHVSILKSAGIVAIIWGVATVTDIVIGGWLVDRLIQRGYDPTRVRKTIFIIGMVMGIAVIGAAFTRSVPLIVMWLSIALGGLAFAAPVGWSIPSLIAPKGTVGVVGILCYLLLLGKIEQLPAPFEEQPIEEVPIGNIRPAGNS